MELAEDLDEMGADIDARAAREDGGVGEQTGTYSLGIHAWSLVPAVALRDQILPPGDRVRDLTQAELERRFGRLGWETNRCSRDLLDDNALIICTFTRLGEVAEVQAHVYFAAAAEPFDARENNQMHARVRQGDGALFVAVRDPATAAALWAALDQPPG